MSGTWLARRVLQNFYCPASACRVRFASTSSSGNGFRKSWTTFAAVATSSVVAGTLGAIYPPTSLSIIFPRSAPAPPGLDTPESYAYTASLEAKLQDLAMLKELRERDDAEEWYEVRPYQGFPEERRVNNFTVGVLKGPGKLALYPLIRAKKDESEAIIFMHLGRSLCGHDGIVHGGLLATVLDETLARTAILNLPEKVGVTAQLTLNYKAPTIADQFVVIKTKVEELKGRKAIISGCIEDLNGIPLVEASGLFVQPRYAKVLQTTQLAKAMGAPTPASGKPSQFPERI